MRSTTVAVGPHTFTGTDARSTFAALGALWRGYVLDLDRVPELAVERASAVATRLEAVLDATATDPEPASEVAAEPGDRLDRVGSEAARRVAGGTWDDDRIEAELAAAWTGIRLVGDELRRSGAIAASGAPSGTVAQLNTSHGGVPKLPVDTADVDHGGVVGDRQATRRHHGRPWQALCLWSREVIGALAADGHPIAPGSAGENVTIAGIDWALVRPGVVLEFGSVRCEVSSFSVPCRQNARWFRNGEFGVIHRDRGPVSRVYATVLEPGGVATGDDVTFLD